MTTTTLDILTAALQEINCLGVDLPSAPSEELPLLLRRYNQILGLRNAQPGTARYVRSQSWAFSVARDSYTIGASGDSPNFAVTAGGPPVEIDSAKIVNTSGSIPLEMPCKVWTKTQYDAQVNMPTLASSFPIGIYYQRSFPLGVIFPWPANPAFTTYKLQLNWEDQLIEVAMTDIATAVRMPPALERDLMLQTAIAICPAYQRTPSITLLRAADAAAMAYRSQNHKPPTISTDAGMNSISGGWNWMTHRPG